MTDSSMDKTPANFNPLAWIKPEEERHGRPERPRLTAGAPAQGGSSHEEELARATAVTRELMHLGANIAESYDDYVRLGFSLANGLGPDGGHLYHLLCSNSAKYRRAQCERKWQECLRQNDGRTTIATFYSMARQAGVELRRFF